MDVLDPLIAKEAAAAALEFVNEQLGQRPIVTVVCSCPRTDHLDGVREVEDEADVRGGKVKIITPVGFIDRVVAENVHTGNAKSHRLPLALCAW